MNEATYWIPGWMLWLCKSLVMSDVLTSMNTDSTRTLNWLMTLRMDVSIKGRVCFSCASCHLTFALAPHQERSLSLLSKDFTGFTSVLRCRCWRPLSVTLFLFCGVAVKPQGRTGCPVTGSQGGGCERGKEQCWHTDPSSMGPVCSLFRHKSSISEPFVVIMLRLLILIPLFKTKVWLRGSASLKGMGIDKIYWY